MTAIDALAYQAGTMIALQWLLRRPEAEEITYWDNLGTRNDRVVPSETRITVDGLTVRRTSCGVFEAQHCGETVLRYEGGWPKIYRPGAWEAEARRLAQAAA